MGKLKEIGGEGEREKKDDIQTDFQEGHMAQESAEKDKMIGPSEKRKNEHNMNSKKINKLERPSTK